MSFRLRPIPRFSSWNAIVDPKFHVRLELCDRLHVARYCACALSLQAALVGSPLYIPTPSAAPSALAAPQRRCSRTSAAVWMVPSTMPMTRPMPPASRETSSTGTCGSGGGGGGVGGSGVGGDGVGDGSVQGGGGGGGGSGGVCGVCIGRGGAAEENATTGCACACTGSIGHGRTACTRCRRASPRAVLRGHSILGSSRAPPRGLRPRWTCWGWSS